jgi:hypothetical protein
MGEQGAGESRSAAVCRELGDGAEAEDGADYAAAGA